MLYLRSIAILFACTLMLGCAPLSSRHPQRAYPDKNHPLSDTAIFSCADAPGVKCSIVSVDYVSTWNHYDGGRTLWVRVLPGLRHITVMAANGRLINRLSFDVEDVQPSHAYAISIDTHGPAMSVVYKDLGKMDAYSLRVHTWGARSKELTAHF
ncbi:MAG: hypothetical protein WA777_15595 [Rhodanobacter sp.]